MGVLGVSGQQIFYFCVIPILNKFNKSDLHSIPNPYTSHLKGSPSPLQAQFSSTVLQTIPSRPSSLHQQFHDIWSCTSGVRKRQGYSHSDEIPQRVLMNQDQDEFLMETSKHLCKSLWVRESVRSRKCNFQPYLLMFSFLLV